MTFKLIKFNNDVLIKSNLKIGKIYIIANLFAKRVRMKKALLCYVKYYCYENNFGLMGPLKGSRDLDYTLRAADTSIQFFIFCIFNDPI